MINCAVYQRFNQFYRSTVGTKIIVAITGVILVLWLLGHMLGNLQMFAGRGSSAETTRINQYAQLLHQNLILLWIVRIVMLKTIVLHVWSTIKLTLINRQARPTQYYVRQYVETSFASRTMIYGGLALFLYIIYHILHLTTASVHSELIVKGDVYQNIINSFNVPLITIIYLFALGMLYLHLIHGVQSTLKTLGVSHPFYLTIGHMLGKAVAIVITLGFASVPIAVFFRVIS